MIREPLSRSEDPHVHVSVQTTHSSPRLNGGKLILHQGRRHVRRSLYAQSAVQCFGPRERAELRQLVAWSASAAYRKVSAGRPTCFDPSCDILGDPRES